MKGFQAPKSINILYQCPHYIVVNKPPFCYSQPPDTRTRSRHDATDTKNEKESPTVISLLTSSYPSLFPSSALAKASSGGSSTDSYFTAPFCEPKLVHRLDFEVSGAMVLATSTHAARWFSRNLKNGGTNKGSKLQKRYAAVLNGDFDSIAQHCASNTSDSGGGVVLKELTDHLIRGTIDLPVQGKPSTTNFWISRTSLIAPTQQTLAMFEPVTGRKHQIRVHAVIGLGAYILGDMRYGDDLNSNSNRIYSNTGAQEGSIALHSSTVKIQFGLARMSVVAPLEWNQSVWKPYVDERNILLDDFVCE